MKSPGETKIEHSELGRFSKRFGVEVVVNANSVLLWVVVRFVDHNLDVMTASE